MGKLRKGSAGTPCLLKPRARGVAAQAACLHGTNSGPSLLRCVCSTTWARNWSRCPGMQISEMWDSGWAKVWYCIPVTLGNWMQPSDTWHRHPLHPQAVQGAKRFPYMQNYRELIHAPKSSALTGTREAQYSGLLSSSDFSSCLFVLTRISCGVVKPKEFIFDKLQFSYDVEYLTVQWNTSLTGLLVIK